MPFPESMSTYSALFAVYSACLNRISLRHWYGNQIACTDTGFQAGEKPHYPELDLGFLRRYYQTLPHWAGKIDQRLPNWWVCFNEYEEFRQVGSDIGVREWDTSLQSPACVPRPGRLFFRIKLAFLNLFVKELSEAKMSIISLIKANKKKRSSMRLTSPE